LFSLCIKANLKARQILLIFAPGKAKNMISYFKRKSQNLSTAIEAVYGLRVNDEPDKSLQLASETFSGMVDFGLENILSQDDDAFIQEITGLGYSWEYLETISKLMLETAEIYVLIDKNDKAINLKNKVIRLLKFITMNDKTYSETRESVIKELEKNIQDDQL